MRNDETTLYRELTSGSLHQYMEDISRGQSQLELALNAEGKDLMPTEPTEMPKLEEVDLVVQDSIKVKEEEKITFDPFENNVFAPFMDAQEDLPEGSTDVKDPTDNDLLFAKLEAPTYKSVLMESEVREVSEKENEKRVKKLMKIDTIEKVSSRRSSITTPSI